MNIAQNVNGNSTFLWKEIRKKKNVKSKVPDCIDDAEGGADICEL